MKGGDRQRMSQETQRGDLRRIGKESIRTEQVRYGDDFFTTIKRRPMNPVESYPDAKHCELCGAMVTAAGVDPLPDHTAAETVRRLALVADRSPAVALLMIHHIAGRSERYIAGKLGISQPAVCRKLMKARAEMLSLNMQKH